MLRSTDPRAKLAVTATLSTLGVFYSSPGALLALAITALLLLPLFGCRLSKTFEALGGFAAALLSMALVQCVFVRVGPPLLQLGGVVLLTTGGVAAAASFLLRMTVIALAAAILSSCNSRTLIQGLVQLRLPYELAFMASMGLRFLPILRDQFRDVVVAMELRGIDFRAASLPQKLRLFAEMLTPVVAGAVLTSRQIAISVQLRGFRAFPTRTSHFTLRFTAVDAALVAASLLFGAGFVYVNYTLGGN